MTKLQELFGGKLEATPPESRTDDWKLTDSQYHFADIYEALAHDDGKAKERALFIAEAVNRYESLLDNLEEISEADCLGEVSKILRNCGIR